MHPFSLTTDRLILRPFQRRDADYVSADARDGDFGRYVPTVPYPYEREHTESFVASAIEADWTCDPHQAIALDGRVTGAVNLALDEVRTAALGYAIGRPWWGQG